MKRAERHHLKENEIERWTREVQGLVSGRRRGFLALLIIVVVIAGAALGYLAWRNRVQTRAQGLLADAMATEQASIAPPPAPGVTAPAGSFVTERARTEAALAKYKATADAYPSTDAGLFARYQQAGLLIALGRPAEAISLYQEVIARSREGLYGQMARLGLAEAQARSGQLDQAINAFKELAQQKEGPLPVDGILMQLGRTYLEAGKPADAQQTFKRLVDEYPNSPFAADAQQRLDDLTSAKS